jgi:RNA polymerase sigma-70 factor (ECF subfamily)
MTVVDSKEMKKIVEGCSSNDGFYQKKLVELYSSLLLFTAKRYVGQSHKAQDILHDALIAILKGIHTFKGEDAEYFEAWMRRIVINIALKDRRKANNRREQNGYQYLPEEGAAPKIYDKMGVDEILVLLNKIPEGYRTIFQMYVIDQMSHDEIAKALDISPSTSRSQLTRARALLRKICKANDKTLTQ